MSIYSVRPARIATFSFLAFLLVAISVSCESRCSAQGLTVQLPVVRFFSVGTTVSVPDGGTMLLGSVSRSAVGNVSRGVPLVGGIPGANRLFNNQGIGIETSKSTATVTTRLIIMSEIEKQVMEEAARLEGEERKRYGGNAVSDDVKRRADFMTRSLRSRKKR